MARKRNGLDPKQISVVAIIGTETHDHLPIYVDKIRSLEQKRDDLKTLDKKYINRTEGISLDSAQRYINKLS